MLREIRAARDRKSEVEVARQPANSISLTIPIDKSLQEENSR